MIVIHSPDDPIAALATPAASSALAVIRVSGPGSLQLLSPLVAGRFDPAAARGHTIHRCTLRDGIEDVDEVLVAVYKAPKSYTGQDGAEVFCHGSLPVIQRILSLLGRAGFRAAGPGEFTQRAFLNGRMGLTQAEAVNEIVRARTDRARGLALQRLGGAIEARIRKARDALVDLRASLEALIDYPDEQADAGVEPEKLAEAEQTLEELIRTSRQGRMYQEGMTVAIAGATNAGKSSLFNALLRQDRAIVSETHGTTRDWLEGTVDIQGIPVRLLDTAGLRETADALEREGVRRTRELIDGADSVLYVVDGTRGMEAADREFLDRGERPAALLRLWNKADLPGVQPAPRGFLLVSAVTGAGIDAVQRGLAEAGLGGAPSDAAEPLVHSERQRDLLSRAREDLRRLRGALAEGAAPELLAVDCADALDALGEITGAVTSDEILDRMFSRFCVGK
ncbi:MAG: tRNA uridine-5-carboxymethylaminomethyl(34) synthesis GTPase MnmE [Spirochaetia bacterium]